VPAIFSFELGNFFGHIAFEKRGIPGHLAERCRSHELLQPIDAVDVCVSFNG
jgi:hypothetical protein